MAKMRFTELYLFITCGGQCWKMLFAAQNEKFLALDSGSGSVLGEGLGLCSAEQRVAAHSQGMGRGSLLSPRVCRDWKFPHGLHWAGGERPWLLL